MFNEIVNHKIGNIAQLVYEINSTTDYAAWYTISGHVEWLEVKVMKGKKDPDSKIELADSGHIKLPHYDWETEESKRQHYQDLEERLTRLQNNLQNVLDNGIELEQTGTIKVKTVPTYRKIML